VRSGSALACLLLAACAGAGHWAKPGADDAATAQQYAECRAVAGEATAKDQAIDQDILASRGTDWQRARTLVGERQNMSDQNAQHVDAIIDACMRAKGFAKPG
jgi:hypothetical protein